MSDAPARRRAGPLLAAALALLVASPVAGAGDPPAPKAKAPAPAKDAPARRAPRDMREALLRLEARRVSVAFDAEPLPAALRHLGTLAGLDLLVAAPLAADGGNELRVTLTLKEVTARQVLSLVAESHRLGVVFRHGVLQVTTAKDARGKPFLRLYDVADLAMAVRDFPGPDLMLRPAGSEVVVEPEEERKGPWSDPETLVALMRDHTGEGTWGDEGVSATVHRDRIAVRQYGSVHREIARLLALLRSSR